MNQVCLTQHGKRDDGKDRRDYSAEAVEYFRMKLEQVSQITLPFSLN